MEEYDFAIEHRPGTRHGNADALSRRPCPKKDCLCKQPAAPLFSGPADRGRPRIQSRYRLWWPAIPPNIETISEEDDFVGEFVETQLNPEAEPFVPVREVSVAAVQVQHSCGPDYLRTA